MFSLMGCAMKKGFIKKKLITDEISANEPMLIKDISIKHVLKMNFLQIMFLVYAVIVIVIALLFM
jgi:hypothetical protein